MTEREKMLAGELYQAWDPELVELRKQARRLLRAYNQTTEEESERRSTILRGLFGATGERIDIEPPFFCDYGSHIRVGNNFYMNFDCVKPITIGNNVWIGGGSIICPGVTIGDNTTIAAGSVVTRDIPENVLAGGNPCRVLRVLRPPDPEP